jgi:hypothetical protein
MTGNLCPFLDDRIDEAQEICRELKQNSFPLDIRPIFPASSTRETFNIITSAKPSAAMIDYRLNGEPRVKSEDLAFRLVKAGIPTVIVTMDRDIADAGNLLIRNELIPVFWKRSLISDIAYMNTCIQKLGVAVPVTTVPLTSEELDYDRLSVLQDKSLLGRLTADEKRELDLYLARLRLDDLKEIGKIKKTELKVDDEFNKLISSIKQLTDDLNNEDTKKHV